MDLLERRRMMIVNGSVHNFTPIEDLTARINVSGAGYYMTDIVFDPGDTVKVKFRKLANNYGCLLGYRKIYNNDQDSDIMEVTNSSMNYYSVRARFGGNYFYSQSAVQLNQAYVVEASRSGMSVNPQLGDTLTGANYNYSSSRNIAVLAMNLENGEFYYGYSGDFYGAEIYDSDRHLKHRLIPQSDLSLKDEVTQKTYPLIGTAAYVDD